MRFQRKFLWRTRLPVNKDTVTNIQLDLFGSLVMAFNLSTTDLKVYFDANVAVNICLFMFLVLPPFLLCLVCVVALVFATEINVKIRLLLINIYAAEISEWLAYAVVYLGWPARQLYDEVGTCHFFISSFAFLGVQKFTAGAIYAIKVFIFIKYGEKT